MQSKDMRAGQKVWSPNVLDYNFFPQSIYQWNVHSLETKCLLRIWRHCRPMESLLLWYQTIYQPVSIHVTSAFFDELTTVYPTAAEWTCHRRWRHQHPCRRRGRCWRCPSGRTVRRVWSAAARRRRHPQPWRYAGHRRHILWPQPDHVLSASTSQFQSAANPRRP